MEIITLIPTMGMLAWCVNFYNSRNLLTPEFILLLFIASVLGLAWALGTTILYLRARHSAFFVALVDLGFVGLFIAAVVLLRGIDGADCASFTSDGDIFVSLGSAGYVGWRANWNIDFNKSCAMLKASWVFGIMNCIFFFFTFFLALLVHRHHRDDRVTVRREYHSSRHGHRRSRDYSPRRSHHSSRRNYYV